MTLHSTEHGVPGVRTPLGVVPVNNINLPPTTHMGVCTEERPVMHWVSALLLYEVYGREFTEMGSAINEPSRRQCFTLGCVE